MSEVCTGSEEVAVRLKIGILGPGMGPSEILAVVPDVDHPGLEVFLDAGSTADGSVEVGYPVGRRPGHLLVELPQEACNGARRVWVPEDAVRDSPERPRVDRRYGCTIPVRVVRDGLHPSEVVVAVRNIDGIDEMVTFTRCTVERGTLDVGWPVGRDEAKHALLVQLGRETHQGAHAVWVPFADVEEIRKEDAA